MDKKVNVSVTAAHGDIVIDITGPQGSGKSVFREKMVCTLICLGARIAGAGEDEGINGDRIRVRGVALETVREMVRGSRRAVLGGG